MNRVARWFVNRSNARRSDRILASLSGHLPLPPSPRLLELGAGPGGLSALLYEQLRPSRLVVSDYDPRQVEAARSNLALRFGGLPPVVDVRRLDALSLPFEPSSFDAVFAMWMLHHVEAHHFDYEKRPGALAEIRRVLAPGGLLAFAEFSRTEEMRHTLAELGFVAVFDRRGWRGRELAVMRAPG
jgi:SAM-dependent methyltransferase